MERNAARIAYVAARNNWLAHVKGCAECGAHTKTIDLCYRPECGAGLALAARQDALVVVPGALEEPSLVARAAHAVRMWLAPAPAPALARNR